MILLFLIQGNKKMVASRKMKKHKAWLIILPLSFWFDGNTRANILDYYKFLLRYLSHSISVYIIVLPSIGYTVYALDAGYLCYSGTYVRTAVSWIFSSC